MISYYIHSLYAAISLPSINTQEGLGVLINRVYITAIALVGLAVLIQFTIAGFTYLLAAGNVGEVGSARTKMQNAILGAILLLGAYLILNVVNPDLTNLDIFNLKCIEQKLNPSLPQDKNC